MVNDSDIQFPVLLVSEARSSWLPMIIVVAFVGLVEALTKEVSIGAGKVG